MLQACFFTGVESTPRITAGDVRRTETPPTREDTFLARVGDEPLASWRPGMTFLVTDPRIARIFGLDDSAGDTLTGRLLSFHSATQTEGVTGTGVTDLTFATPGGTLLDYRINRPMASLMESQSLTVPFTVQTGMAASADSACRGLRVYTLTGLWRDPADSPVRGLKFVHVTIDSVTPGNSIFPLRVAFTADDGVTGNLFIYPGSRDSAPRTFGSVFSFTDPRLRYPSITDTNWDLITRGRVAVGMTTQECRLALGAPAEINRGATQNYIHEAWSYENGRYLLFEDGLLKSVR